MSSAVVTLMFPESLSERYDRLAKKTGRTKTFYLTMALSEEIDRLEYEYGILKDMEDYRAGRLETFSLDEVGNRVDQEEVLAMEGYELADGTVLAREDIEREGTEYENETWEGILERIHVGPAAIIRQGPGFRCCMPGE